MASATGTARATGTASSACSPARPSTAVSPAAMTDADETRGGPLVLPLTPLAACEPCPGAAEEAAGASPTAAKPPVAPVPATRTSRPLPACVRSHSETATTSPRVMGAPVCGAGLSLGSPPPALTSAARASTPCSGRRAKEEMTGTEALGPRAALVCTRAVVAGRRAVSSAPACADDCNGEADLALLATLLPASEPPSLAAASPPSSAAPRRRCAARQPKAVAATSATTTSCATPASRADGARRASVPPPPAGPRPAGHPLSPPSPSAASWCPAGTSFPSPASPPTKARLGPASSPTTPPGSPRRDRALAPGAHTCKVSRSVAQATSDASAARHSARTGEGWRPLSSTARSL
mmetsp:Transcript_15430/g.58385  ORF Transcript_15430/g.58385 Transcript_15430/m.58385 type:complete len:352 (-) Transcript_15430:1451-2506(-)